MKRVKEKSGFTFSGYVLFFITLAVTVSIAVVIFAALKDKGFSSGFIALYLLLYLFFSTFVFCLIDLIRRKIMVDSPAERYYLQQSALRRGIFPLGLRPNINLQSTIERTPLCIILTRWRKNLARAKY